MPRLSTLLLAFSALSASLAPVLSLDTGRYTICQSYPRDGTLCLTSLSEFDEEVTMRRLGDAFPEEQLWDVTTSEGDAISFTNAKYGCGAIKDSIGLEFSVLRCASGQSNTFNLIRSEGGSDTYHVDSPDGEPKRMYYEPFASPNVTFTVSEDQTPFTQFVFERAAGGA